MRQRLLLCLLFRRRRHIGQLLPYGDQGDGLFPHIQHAEVSHHHDGRDAQQSSAADHEKHLKADG